MSRPRSIIGDASSFITSAISSPLAFLSGGTVGGIGGSPLKATPEEVFDGEIDLNDEEVLEQERGEEGEVDDSPEALRRLRVLTIVSKEANLGRNARLRRKWEVLSLRQGVAHRRNSKATEASKQG
jgi:DDB1- and CUL4-associated factor 11